MRSTDQHAVYFRDPDDIDPELQSSHLISNISQRITDDFEAMKDALNSVEEYEDCKVITSPVKQYQHIIETLKKYSTMTIQDDESNWNLSGNQNTNGKLMLLDQADYNTLHIFFDDRAIEGKDCIVDVRDAITKEILPYKKFKNTYVVHVEPHRAILEGDYFIKMIELAER